MNWYIGQRIVTIRDHSQGDFKKGDKFVIKGLRRSQCLCREIEIDIGNMETGSFIGCCDRCRYEWWSKDNKVWYSEKMFAPIDEIESFDISELTELLTSGRLA